MKVVLTIEEAREYLGAAFVEAVFPGKPMKLTSVEWSKYDHEVTITVEADGEEFLKAKGPRDQLARSYPSTPSAPERTLGEAVGYAHLDHSDDGTPM